MVGLLLYQTGLFFYALAARLAALFNNKVRKWLHGQRQAWQQLTNLSEQATGQQVLWFHCASVGEYEQGRPLMAAIKQQNPRYHILVSFFSPSGYEAIQADEVVDYKIYLPLDSASHARRFIGAVRPQAAFFIKYEFWHYYLHELKRQNIPVFSVSAIFRPNQLFFKWYGSFYRQILTCFSHFFVQDSPSLHLLGQLGLPATLSGDTRIDRVLSIRDSPADLPLIEAFAREQQVMVIGSLRQEDKEVVLPFIRQHPGVRFIVAPHEITTSMLTELTSALPGSVRYSELQDAPQDKQVLIIDNIGMLARLYRFGQLAYVGGGFSDGLHNILEAAVYGIPVFFGNQAYHKFKEAHDLIELGAAFPVKDSQDLAEKVRELQQAPQHRQQIKESLYEYMEKNRGATDRIMAVVQPYLQS